MNSKQTGILKTSSITLAASLLAMTGVAHEQPKSDVFNPGARYAAEIAGKMWTGRPPLYEGIGTMTMPITTKSAGAQAYFDQGLRLAWNFNHAEARRSFREAQRLDPECAMCFWGEAFVLGPNINDAMRDEAVAPAQRAMGRALALWETVTIKEGALIEALSSRYGANSTEGRLALDQSWADALGEVVDAHPKDADVLALYAEALMNLQPWDYWEADGLTPKGIGGEVVAVLERAMALDPDHLGAAHLYIHAVEASADPGRAEVVADRLRGAAPAAGHLTHMPAHLYIRLGRHADSIAVNHDAIAADEAFLSQAGKAASPLYRFGDYPHNVHLLMISAQMAGVKEDVIHAAEKLAAITSDEVSQELAWVQAIKTAPFSAHAQFSDPHTILALADPGDQFPLVKGYWHYARGVALALQGNAEAASAEADSIGRLIQYADMSGLEEQSLPAKDLLRIAMYVTRGRIAQSRGDLVAAEQELTEAIRRQEDLPYMDPPYWYYPVRQTFAAMLLQQGRADEAVLVFEKALEEAPRNGWALWGLLKAKISASSEDISATKADFKKAWLGDEALLALERL